MNTKILALALVRILSTPTKMYGVEGDEADVAAKAAAEKAAAEKAAADKAAADAKKYSQAEFDKHMAAQRRQAEANLKKTADALEKLSEDKRLTQEERDNYAKQLEEVQSQYKTQKEMEEQRVKKLTEESSKKHKQLEQERDTYKTKYQDKMIDVELTEAFSADEAAPGQLKKFFKPDTTLVDELNVEGKPTGNQVVVINFDDVDGDGKPVKLQLPPKEVVKKIKEKPETYGNLLKGSGTGGVGGTNGKGGGGNAGAMPTDTAAYIAKRNAKK